MLLPCTHTAFCEHAVAQFTIRHCKSTAVNNSNKAECRHRGTQGQSIEDGVSLCACGSYCYESLTLKMIVQSILYYVVFLEITIIFDHGL